MTPATPTPSTSTTKNDALEAAFQLIQAGNDHESSSEPWQASASFAQAADLLDQLAKDALFDHDMETDDDSRRRIADLYANQSLEYVLRSRTILLTSLQDEHDRDKQKSQEARDGSDDVGRDGEAPANKIDSLVRSSLSEEELDQRVRLFASLFARPLPTPTPTTTIAGDHDAETDAAIATEKSLEDRWRQLNQSLPKSVKTSEQRLDDINRGLNRLGLSSVQYSYDPSSTTSRMNPLDVLGSEANKKTESEQVDDIIAQATDEVRLLQHQMEPLHSESSGLPLPGSVALGAGLYGGPVASSDSDPDASEADDSTGGSDADDDEDEAAEADLTADQITKIAEWAVTAQTELAQLLALLERDEGGDAAIEFDPASGRHHLRAARVALRRARNVWTPTSTTTATTAEGPYHPGTS